MVFHILAMNLGSLGMPELELLEQLIFKPHTFIFLI